MCCDGLVVRVPPTRCGADHLPCPEDGASIAARSIAASESLSGPLGRYDGLALMFGGLVLIVIATARFVRTGRRLDDPETHPATNIRVELILSAVVGFMTAAASTAPVFRQITQNSMVPMHPRPGAEKHDRAPCDSEPDGSRHKRIGFWRYPDSQVGPTSWVKAGTNRQIIH